MKHKNMLIPLLLSLTLLSSCANVQATSVKPENTPEMIDCVADAVESGIVVPQGFGSVQLPECVIGAIAQWSVTTR